MCENNTRLGFGKYFILIFLIGILPLLFNDSFAEKTIFDDSTGGDCTTFGAWDSGTKTCTLTNDLSEGITIRNNGITIDGNEHSISGTRPREIGILVESRLDITIKNLVIQNFDKGISIDNSINVIIKENTISNNNMGVRISASDKITFSGNMVTNNGGRGFSTTGTQNMLISNNIASNNLGYSAIEIEGGDNNIISDNTITDNTQHGIVLANARFNTISNNIITDNESHGINLQTNAQNNIINDNTISNNSAGIGTDNSSWGTQASGNLISQNSFAGLHVWGAFDLFSKNTLSYNGIGIDFYSTTVSGSYYNNNFIDNIKQILAANSATFDGGPITGGNYWSDFSPTCLNENQDQFCDEPYPFSGGIVNVHDNFVWTIQDGWLTEIQIPNDITIEATDSTGSIVDYSVSTTFAPSHPEYIGFEPPLKQIAQGTPPDEVICNEGLQLIMKNNGSSACVKFETAVKLEERGWGVMPPPCCKKMHQDVPQVGQILITDGNPPTSLGLPYAISDLDLEHGASHPLGVFRFAKDVQPHPGIDLQLYDGTKILAMGDGTIVKIREEGNFPGDMGILLQIEETLWGVNYEHFILDEGLYIGKKISKGEQIGTFSGGYTKIPASVHIDLRYYPDGFTGYSAAFVCWFDNLESDDKAKLQSAWDKAKVTDEFIQGWSTLEMEGNFIFKGLLDSAKYPDGPQMCYPIGTDVRVDVNPENS